MQRHFELKMACGAIVTAFRMPNSRLWHISTGLLGDDDTMFEESSLEVVITKANVRSIKKLLKLLEDNTPRYGK
jgi:hypothetical protein